MEKFAAGFAVLGALVVLAANVSVSEAENSYFKAGGELQLSPVPVSEEITSIVWKYDKNLLAEWIKDSVTLTFYSRFKGRSELNTVTGVLVVRNVTAADKAVYSVEINNKVQSLVYQAVEIQDVPQPTVEFQPLACGPTFNSCRLICEGNVDQAGPVTYYWKKGDGGWEQSDNNIMELNNTQETQRLKTFSCKMKNPVSEKESSPINNKFYKHTADAPSGGGNGGITAAVISLLVVGVVVGATVGVYMAHKRKLLCFKNSDRTPVNTSDGDGAHQTASPANGETKDSA